MDDDILLRSPAEMVPQRHGLMRYRRYFVAAMQSGQAVLIPNREGMGARQFEAIVRSSAFNWCKVQHLNYTTRMRADANRQGIWLWFIPREQTV